MPFCAKQPLIEGDHSPMRRAIVYLLVIVFAMASWIDINGVWVELPLLVPRLPEGWGLPSYMAVLIQLANIGPLLVTLYNYFSPRHQSSGHCDVPISYLIIGVGIVSCLLMALFWDRTSALFGQQHSTALLFLCFFLAFVDCTSSVVFLPFMALFKPEYMTAFFIGEGFSGLVPSLAALVQGVGGNPSCVLVNKTHVNKTDNTSTVIPELEPVYPPPRFGVEEFFFFLMVLMSLSFLALALLDNWTVALKERVAASASSGGACHRGTVRSDAAMRDRRHSSRRRRRQDDEEGDESGSEVSGQMSASSSVISEKPIWQASNSNQNFQQLTLPSTGNSSVGISAENSQVNLIAMVDPSDQNAVPVSVANGQVAQHLSLPHSPLVPDGRLATPEKEVVPMLLKSHVVTNCDYVLLLFAQALICALCNGILPSIQSYASLPYGNEAYHLAVTLSAIANPLACFFALWLPSRSRRLIFVLTVFGSLLSAYVVVLAAMSPNPLLKDSDVGRSFIVLAQMAISAFFSYAKVTIATIFRDEGRRALVWCGAITQVGSSVGALIMFPLVNVYYVFKSNPPCQ